AMGLVVEGINRYGEEAVSRCWSGSSCTLFKVLAWSLESTIRPVRDCGLEVVSQLGTCLGRSDQSSLLTSLQSYKGGSLTKGVLATVRTKLDKHPEFLSEGIVPLIHVQGERERERERERDAEQQDELERERERERELELEREAEAEAEEALYREERELQERERLERLERLEAEERERDRQAKSSIDAELEESVRQSSRDGRERDREAEREREREYEAERERQRAETELQAIRGIVDEKDAALERANAKIAEMMRQEQEREEEREREREREMEREMDRERERERAAMEQQLLVTPARPVSRPVSSASSMYMQSHIGTVGRGGDQMSSSMIGLPSASVKRSRREAVPPAGLELPASTLDTPGISLSLSLSLYTLIARV
ncbi:hypothetical protein KIPB_009514, partial [Kipferlia bialata]